MAMSWTSLTAVKTTAGSIRRWVNWDELDADQCLEEAQALIYQTLRVREMRTEFSDLSLAVGDYYKALPTGFLDPIALIDKTNNIRLKMRTEPALLGRRFYDVGVLASGTPENFAIFGERFQFEYKYDAIATLNLVGYKSLDLLSVSNTTNFLTTRYPHMLRTACLVQAFSMMNNQAREQTESAKLVALIQKTNAESDLSLRGMVPDGETP